jgi:hypothetical protein
VSYFGQCLLRLVKTGKAQTSKRFLALPPDSGPSRRRWLHLKTVNAYHLVPAWVVRWAIASAYGGLMRFNMHVEIQH